MSFSPYSRRCNGLGISLEETSVDPFAPNAGFKNAGLLAKQFEEQVRLKNFPFDSETVPDLKGGEGSGDPEGEIPF